MTAIKAIAPVLMLIALIAPIVTGYRREKLGTSIRIGWALVVFTYFAADFLIPELALLLYGREAERSIVPNNSGTLPMLFFGWLFPLILHYAGFVLCEAVDVLRDLLSKIRRD